jgi:hypothetical protein
LAAPHSGEVVSVAGGAAAALSVLFAVKSAAAGGIEQQVSNGASHPVRALLAAGPPCLGFRAVGAGFAKPVGTGPVRPVPGGSGPTRYMNRSGSHPRTVPKIFNSQRTIRFDQFTGPVFEPWEPAFPPFG